MLRRLREWRIPVLRRGRPAPAEPPMVEAAFGDLLTITGIGIGIGDTVVEDCRGTVIPLPDGGYDSVSGPLPAPRLLGRH